MRVDFIVPCFNEEESVRAFYEEFSAVFDAAEVDWTLVMVDDGSKDATFDMLQKLSADPRVKVIQFSRNFGKEAAIYAGLSVADADYVGLIDADLQQLPSTALEMLSFLDMHDEYDCVAAYQAERHDGFLVSFLKRSFYKVFSRAARSNDVIPNASDFRVFRRSVAEAILLLPEYHRFSKGIFSWIGFNTYAYPYEPEERRAGESKWSIMSLFSYAFEGILSFSTSPLHFITVLGVATSTIAFIYALVIIIKTLVVGIDVPGYASTTALVLLLGGVQILSLGIIGEYLARLYIQEKNRPVYIIKTAINIEKATKCD